MTWLTQRAAWLSSRLRLRDNLIFAAHAALLIGLMFVYRPLFMLKPADRDYRAPVIVWSLIRGDFVTLQRFFLGRGLGGLDLLFLLLPTAILLVARRRLRWTDFDHGKSLRNFICVVLGVLVWSGSTADYNSYLDLGHFVDRGLLVAFGVASYFTPLAVPFALRLAFVLIKEAYVPIHQDDFDFRSLPEVLTVFSCFVWASFFKSFKTRHFLFAGIACWASYYFAAGVAKMNVGPEWWSWTLTDHVSNLSMGAHIRGWASWVSDDHFIAFNNVVRKGDLVSTLYTMILELGALFAFFVRPRLTKWMFLGCFTLHFGIFTLTGICFWKWMIANLAFFLYLGWGGQEASRGDVQDAARRRGDGHSPRLVLPRAHLLFPADGRRLVRLADGRELPPLRHRQEWKAVLHRHQHASSERHAMDAGPPLLRDEGAQRDRHLWSGSQLRRHHGARRDERPPACDAPAREGPQV